MKKSILREKRVKHGSRLEKIVNEILFRERIVSAVIPLIGLAVSLLYVIYMHSR